MFEKSIEDMGTGRYLGDTKVVTRLVGQFISEVANNVSDVNALMRIVNHQVNIFLGLDDYYVTIPDWNDKEHLGVSLSERLSVSYNQPSAVLFQGCFMEFAIRVMTIVKNSPGKSDDVIQKEVDALKKYMVSILIGTADTLYPNNKDEKSDDTKPHAVDEKVVLSQKPKAFEEGYHPKRNDKGGKVPIYNPSKPTQADTWVNHGEIATVA